MTPIDPIYVGDNAIAELLAYCDQQDLDEFVLVADTNTYAALGKLVDEALRQRYEVTTIVLTGDEIKADEKFLMKTLVQAPVKPQTFIAVGSGTITDITRFVSYRTRNPFISMPTAPSVDGFTSIGAPLVLDGVKQTLISQAPMAVFADLPTLTAAPKRLIAAGYGDMLGKMTSLADWKLGYLLWDEPYDEDIAVRSKNALDTCIALAADIGKGDAEGIRDLMQGLIESGLCMLDFGASRPASGAEHHCSHYWEMMLLQAKRPALLHGAKVGFATAYVAGLYDILRESQRGELQARIEFAKLKSRDVECDRIRAAYGPTSDSVIEAQSDFLNMTDA